MSSAWAPLRLAKGPIMTIPFRRYWALLVAYLRPQWALALLMAALFGTPPPLGAAGRQGDLC